MVRKPTISALRAGDESAWRWFCQEFNHSISAYARGKGSSDAENLAGNVMESVARSIHKFNGNHKAFRSWVFSIAHNHIVDDFRRQERRPESPSGEIEGLAGSYEACFDLGIDPDLSEVLHHLNAAQQEALTLRYAWGFSCREVAKKIDKSESATRVMLHRSLKQVRMELDKESPELQEHILSNRGARS
jgi:RNA polymerase sigma-70 factor (ECF subfamily)